jgi:hypothetical protein
MSTTTGDFRPSGRGTLRGIETPDESTPSLLRRLADDVGMLFAQELALLKAEMMRSVSDLKAATMSIAMGGAVTVMGIFFLLLSAVYGLSNVVDPWLAALIVGGAVALIGIIMLATGRRKLEPAAVAPRRTAAALRKDTEMIKGVARHEHQ